MSSQVFNLQIKKNNSYLSARPWSRKREQSSGRELWRLPKNTLQWLLHSGREMCLNNSFSCTMCWMDFCNTVHLRGIWELYHEVFFPNPAVGWKLLQHWDKILDAAVPVTQQENHHEERQDAEEEADHLQVGIWNLSEEMSCNKTVDSWSVILTTACLGWGV